MIAAVGWCVWRMPRGRGRSVVVGLFCAYMFYRWGWSFVFFGAQAIFAGFVWIVVYDIIALALVIKAWKAERRVAYLMLPSLVWTVFAAALNFAYWQLK